MLMELQIMPVGRGETTGDDIADLVGLIDESKLPYKVTGLGTLIEGSWEELMNIAKQCHKAIRMKTDRVLLIIKIEDYANHPNLLSSSVAHVEKRLGRQVDK